MLACVLLFACGGPQKPPAKEPVVKDLPDQAVGEAPVTDSTTTEEQVEDDGHHVGALETYRYWAGKDPDDDMKVLNGEYWSSAHWTKEYTLYLELRFPRAKDFVMGRNFTRAEQWTALQHAPEWFDPSANYELWIGSLGSRYYLHPTKGHLYIFERQF